MAIVNPSATTVAFTISNIALKMAQQYLSMPSLNGIPLYTYEYTEVNGQDVSDQMLIDSTGGRISFSDNIALRPRQWQIKAYLKSTPVELTNWFLPSLLLQKNSILLFRQLRTLINFKDVNQNFYRVVIEDLEFPQAPDTGNAKMINVTLKEINILSAVTSQENLAKAAATPVSGSGSAASSSIGSAASQAVSILPATTAAAANVSSGLGVSIASAVVSTVIPAFVPIDKKGNPV